ncbi:MAG: flagellar filament capping protein FliD, partial [Limnochordales bacterium]
DDVGNLAMFESSGDTTVYNGSCCYGILQLTRTNIRTFAGVSPEEFRNWPLQDQVNAWADLTTPALNYPSPQALMAMGTFDGRPVDGHLVLTAAETNQKIEFEKSDVLIELGILDDNGQDGDPVPKHELQSPQEAVIWVDGIRVTRDSNTISDVIQGVTLTLKETGTVTVEVRHDVNRVVDRVRAFVDQYNSVQSFISDKTSRGQILQGDVLLSRIQMELRQLTMAPVLGSDGAYNQLAMIGITIDRHGTMSLDEAKLRAVLEEDPEAVHRLFAATQEEDGFDGVAVRLGQRLEQWLRSNEGLLASRQQLFDDRMKDIDRSIERLEARLELREQTLRRQFIALEEVLSAFQTQAMWLEGQIQQLNAFAWSQARRR